MKARTILCLSFVVLLSAPAFAAEPDAKQILDKVAERYKAMQTYQAEGTVVVDIETKDMKMHSETTFSMKLKKPDLYLITWTQKGMPMAGMQASGAVWNAGDGPYLYTGIGDDKTYSKESNDEMALAAATGVSGGVANTIPSLFRQSLAHPIVHMPLLSPKLDRIEKLDEEECYVITGDLFGVFKRTYWVSTKSQLILQVRQSRVSGEKGLAEPEMTDQQLETAVKAGGGEATKEEMAKMKEAMKTMREAMPNMTYSSRERHDNISSPELAPADFQFKLPEGAVLKESFFDTAMTGKVMITVKMSDGVRGAMRISAALHVYAAEHDGAYPTLAGVKGDALADTLGIKPEDLADNDFKAASYEVTSTPKGYTIKATLGAETYIINQDGVESGTYRTDR